MLLLGRNDFKQNYRTDNGPYGIIICFVFPPERGGNLIFRGLSLAKRPLSVNNHVDYTIMADLT